jgi:hypothetical protein
VIGVCINRVWRNVCEKFIGRVSSHSKKFTRTLHLLGNIWSDRANCNWPAGLYVGSQIWIWSFAITMTAYCKVHICRALERLNVPRIHFLTYVIICFSPSLPGRKSKGDFFPPRTFESVNHDGYMFSPAAWSGRRNCPGVREFPVPSNVQ